MNVPQLRFSGFDGEWEKFTLGDIAIVKDGTHDSPKYHVEGYPLVTSKNLLKNGDLDLKNVSFISENDFFEINKRSKVDVGDILFGMIGTIGNPVRVQSSEFAIKNVALIKESQVSNEYILHYLGSKAIEKQFHLNQAGGTQKFIGLGLIRNLKISIPGVKEIQKVNSFFTLLDKRINMQQENIEKLEQFKKGMMQKIYSQELRFKNEDGGEFPEWEENIRAKELFKSISNKNHAGDLPVLSASQENGIVLRDSNNIQIQFSIDNLVNYKKVEPNDFVISLRSFQGGIEYSQILGIMSPAYTIFKAFDEETIYSPYFSFLFKTTDFITRLNNLTYGIRDGKAISFTDFSTMTFNVPSLQEQKKVADYLLNIDRKIEKEKEKLLVLGEQKKGFMWGMFV